MGIGNLAGAPMALTIQQLAYALRSLPLMGIGNHGAHIGGNAKVYDLITPHGDRKPFGVNGMRLLLRISLPLMGIGNRVTRGDEFLPGAHLITPHGDRKPYSRWHHSNEEIDSLPLMGIGNPRSTGGATPAHTCSLPLMGIGNTAEHLGSARQADPHYPSWGSETRSLLSTRRLAVQGSLPLMGIGNSCCRNRAPDRPSPHYPSWGSETSGPRPPRAASRQEELITPHGDRKHDAGHPRRRRRTHAHYPSWGSETKNG